MLGKFGSIVEADGFTQLVWKLCKLTVDGVGGCDRLAIARTLDAAEATLPF